MRDPRMSRMSMFAAVVRERHLRPGLLLELRVQTGLTTLDRDQIMRVPGPVDRWRAHAGPTGQPAVTRTPSRFRSDREPLKTWGSDRTPGRHGCSCHRPPQAEADAGPYVSEPATHPSRYRPPDPASASPPRSATARSWSDPGASALLNPSFARCPGPASAIHSPITGYEPAPGRTAHRSCQQTGEGVTTTRRLRGSSTPERAPSMPGGTPSSATRPAGPCRATVTMSSPNKFALLGRHFRHPNP